jgi:thioredoxin-like negative regulator of GroEL
MLDRRAQALVRITLVLGVALPGCRAQPTEEGGIRPEASARSAQATEARPRAPVHAAGVAAAETWNAQQIDWQGYEAGLARAKAEGKPLCLVLYTNWCPHCRNYSHVFDDPKVVERAKGFVMVRANADEEPELAGKFAKDGGYVPRTFFLAPDGTLAEDIHAPRPKYRYFFDEHNPASLLGGMDEAQRTLARSP